MDSASLNHSTKSTYGASRIGSHVLRDCCWCQKEHWHARKGNATVWLLLQLRGVRAPAGSQQTPQQVLMAQPERRLPKDHVHPVHRLHFSGTQLIWTQPRLTGKQVAVQLNLMGSRQQWGLWQQVKVQGWDEDWSLWSATGQGAGGLQQTGSWKPTQYPSCKFIKCGFTIFLVTQNADTTISPVKNTTDHLAFVFSSGYFTKGPEPGWKKNTMPCGFAGQIPDWCEWHFCVSSCSACRPRMCSPTGLQLTRPATEQVGRPLNFLYEAGSKLIMWEPKISNRAKIFRYV